MLAAVGRRRDPVRIDIVLVNWAAHALRARSTVTCITDADQRDNCRARHQALTQARGLTRPVAHPRPPAQLLLQGQRL